MQKKKNILCLSLILQEQIPLIHPVISAGLSGNVCRRDEYGLLAFMKVPRHFVAKKR